MVIPKVAICPICGKKTYLRIEDGGYLNEYPFRVHCANCRALIKGVYIMGSSSGEYGLHMYNAKTEECDIDSVSHKILNADYVVDISGELPCKKVREFDGNLIASSPFLEAADQVDMLERIERLKYFVKNMEEWKAWRSIAFQLLDEGSVDFISTAFTELKWAIIHISVIITSNRSIVYRKSFRKKRKTCFTSQIKTIAFPVCSESFQKPIESNCIYFVEQMGGVQDVIASYRRVIYVFSAFMDIYPNILPAETYIRFNNKDKEDVGIATCSFGDIKTFYQDAYETLLSLMFIPVCLDNITLRNDFQVYNSTFDNLFGDWKYKKLPNDYSRYIALDNGMKLEKVQLSEPLQQLLNIPANRFLRNGIGHNNIKYDGLSQTIIAFDLKNPSKAKLTKSLMDMAIDCIGLSKVAVLMAEILLFIIRQEVRSENIHSIIHPRFYKKVELNDKCPCGSNIKYKKCCKAEIESISYQARKTTKA